VKHARILLVALALAGSTALAEAPATSLRPEASPLPRVTMSMAGQPRAAAPPPLRPGAILALPGPAAAPGTPPAGAARPATTAQPVTAAPDGSLLRLRPRVRPDAAALAAGAAVPGPVVVSRAVEARALGSLFPLDAVPRPPERPEGVAAPERIEVATFRTQPAPEIITGRRGSVCGDPALKGVTLAPIAGRIKGCGLTDGVKLTSVDGIPLSTPATVDCTTALALRSWVTDGLKPVIGKRGGGVARIEIAGSYSCRPRNNQKGQVISEHGRGRAVDITGIILRDGEIITVLRDWGRGQQGKILAGLHWMACQSFGTVLGPAADRFHRDHFHFDTARNRRSGSYCR
jgi:hypothetical protein